MELGVKGVESWATPQNPEQANLESNPAPQRSKIDQLREVRDATKQRVTCTCAKVTWRIIRIGISLWQLGDMVSDIIQTRKYYHLSTVSRIRLLMI